MKTKLGIALLMLVICASAFAAPADNSQQSTNAVSKKPASPKPTLIFNRKLLSTSVAEDEPLVSVPGGLVATAIDTPLTFKCPTGGCTLTSDIHVQIGAATVAQNRWALCSEIDGVIMPPNACPFVGEVLSDGLYGAGSFEFIQNGVKAGTHQIQSFVYTDDGALLATYDITYRLYVP
jgi:hypothetical protein